MMTNPQQTGPWSGKSYAFGGLYRGRVESIKDPEHRNRIQVRIFGYQDDQGNITKESLEWLHVNTPHNNQMPGDSATQPFYAGADVNIVDYGTERYVLGSIPGFDKEDWLVQNPWGANKDENKKPDVPDIQRTEAKGGGELRTRVRDAKATGINKGVPDQYFKLENFPKILHNIFKVSIGEEAPAPFGEGTKAILRDLKSIGVDKLLAKSDILDVINQLDGNYSGAIQAAINIIKNLRNNGFGTGMSTIGSGNIAAADGQFNATFGTVTTANVIVSLLEDLLAVIRIINNLTAENLWTQLAEIDNTIILLSNPSFEIDSSALDAIAVQLDNLRAAGSNQPLAFYEKKVDLFQHMFAPLFIQALASQLNTVDQVARQGESAIQQVNNFGGVDGLTKLASALHSVAAAVNVPAKVINDLVDELMGKALTGELGRLLNQSGGPIGTNSSTGGGGSGGSQASNPLTLIMNKFIGNPVALKELMGGGLVKEFLTKNPIKYEKNDRNDGMQVLKQFKDGLTGSIMSQSLLSKFLGPLRSIGKFYE